MSREGVAADLEFDPSYKRQRELARIMLGIAINALCGGRTVFTSDQPIEDIGKELKKLALAEGIVWFDDFHHAPACPANNWSRQQLPTGPCTCGAERLGIR